MLKEIFHDRFKISKFARMKNHSSVTAMEDERSWDCVKKPFQAIVP